MEVMPCGTVTQCLFHLFALHLKGIRSQKVFQLLCMLCSIPLTFSNNLLPTNCTYPISFDITRPGFKIIFPMFHLICLENLIYNINHRKQSLCTINFIVCQPSIQTKGDAKKQQHPRLSSKRNILHEPSLTSS